MKSSTLYRSLLGAALVLLLVSACAPFQLGRATATPSPVADTPTFTVTPADTMTPRAPATATGTPTPFEGTLSPTPTAAPPTETAVFTLSPTAIPPTVAVQPSNTPVPPTNTPVPPTRTPVPITDWRGEYYANMSLQGSPTVVRNDRVVDLSLPAGASPAPGVPAEFWSARWSRSWTFDEGNYRFRLLVDDGARLWVGGRLLIDAWADGPAREFTADLYLRGEVPIRLDYYNHLGAARARLNWEKVTQFAGWKGSYFDNIDLSGLPVFQRDDPAINFNWGSGSPRSDIPADNFSVRWTRRPNLNQTGAYRFRTVSDDGLRLWVDGVLVIDAWRDGYSTDEAVVRLVAGAHDLRVDYYEHTGGALAEVTWALEAVPPTPTYTPSPIPPTATYTPSPIPPTVTREPPTPQPPTPVLPTLTPLQPTAGPLTGIFLEPDSGPIGQPFTVVGQGWPAVAQVDLFLLQPGTNQPTLPPVGQAVSDGRGSFRVQIAVPAGQGWEGQEIVPVLARTTDGAYQARAGYRLLPQQVSVPFQPIPAGEDRFALAEPAYLVFDSADAWAMRFGPEPPAADPALDWQREIVLGVFLGSQPQGVTADVASIARRDATVVVSLAGNVLAQVAPTGPGANLPRSLVRVSRSDLGIQPPGTVADLQFIFQDARGRVLIQGPGRALGPAAAGPAPEARALEAPAEAAPALEAPAEAAPPGAAPAEATVAPELVQPESEVVPPAPKAEEEAAAAVAARPTRADQPARTITAWLALVLWVVLILALVVGAVLVFARYRRQR